MFRSKLQRWTESTALEKLDSFSPPSSHVQLTEPVDQHHGQQQTDVSQCLICCQTNWSCRIRSNIAKLCICDKVRCTPQRAVRSVQSALREQALPGEPPTGCQRARGSVCWCALCPNAASARCWTSSWLPCLRLSACLGREQLKADVQRLINSSDSGSNGVGSNLCYEAADSTCSVPRKHQGAEVSPRRDVDQFDCSKGCTQGAAAYSGRPSA